MGYYEFRKKEYPYNYIVSIVAIILSVSGGILSTLVVFLMLKNKRRKLSIDLKLICLTLIFNMLHCFLTFITAVCNIVGFAEYLNSRFSCTLNSVLTIFTATASINLLGVVTLERYLHIIKQKPLNIKIYYMFISGLQLINLASGVISGVFGGFSISSTSVYCTFDLYSWAGMLGSTVLNVSIGASIFMIYFGYVNIMIKRRNSALEIQKLFPLRAKKIRNKANSIILKSILVIIASSFTTLPYSAILFIPLFNPRFLTPLTTDICILSTMFNMVLNTLIVLRLRLDLWNGLKVLFLESDNIDLVNGIMSDLQLETLNEGTSNS